MGHFVDRVVWRRSGEGVLEFANAWSTDNGATCGRGSVYGTFLMGSIHRSSSCNEYRQSVA